MPGLKSPIDFEDARAVRKFGRVISCSIILGAAAFAAVINVMPMEAAGGDPAEHELYTPFVIIATGLVLFATLIGTRMHGIRGTPEERNRKTLLSHIFSLALSEGAAFLGLVFVLMTHSWKPILPAALGFAGLATCAIRGEVRLSALVDDADALKG